MENLDLKAQLAESTPLVIAVVLVLGFLIRLLLVPVVVGSSGPEIVGGAP